MYIKEYNQFSKDDEDVWQELLSYYKKDISYYNNIRIPDDKEIEEDILSSDHLNKDYAIQFWKMLPIKMGYSVLTKKEAMNVIDNAYAYYQTADGIAGLLAWVDTYHKYKENGGTLYRLIWLTDIEDFNLTNPGNHWTYEEYVLHDFYMYYMTQYYKEHTTDRDPYIIKANIPSGLNLGVGSFDRSEEMEIFVSDEDQDKIQLVSISKVDHHGRTLFTKKF
jgi:hypothetical protein